MSADDGTTGEDAPFHPERYLTQISGRDYLEVKFRLLWLRSVHPDAVIETDMREHSPGNYALFTARVTTPHGGAATGWGSETHQDFPDYIEKAETKAIGRALAALGYGTQFCTDHDEQANERGNVVDSPGRRPGQGGFGGNANGGGMVGAASERQIAAIFSIGHAGRLSDDRIRSLAVEFRGKEPEDMSRRDASDFIDFMKQRFAESNQSPARPATAPATATEMSGKPSRNLSPIPPQSAQATADDGPDFDGFWRKAAASGWTPIELNDLSKRLEGERTIDKLDADGLKRMGAFINWRRRDLAESLSPVFPGTPMLRLDLDDLKLVAMFVRDQAGIKQEPEEKGGRLYLAPIEIGQ